MSFSVALSMLIAASGGVSQPPLLLPPAFFRVPSIAMEPTLPAGSLVVSEVADDAFRRDDIVAAQIPGGSRLALRVVGLPGDKIQLRDGAVLVNGEAAEDRARGLSSTPPLSALFPRGDETYVVPAATVYLLADNRREGVDSRHFGALGIETISGRLIPWPQALQRKGRVKAVFSRALAPIQARLPLDVGNGMSLQSVDAVDDAALKISYTMESTMLEALSIDRAAYAIELAKTLCAIPLIKLAKGLSIRYEFTDSLQRKSVAIDFDQVGC